MKASIITLLSVAAAVSAKTVSTVYETEHYTITSCAPTVTDCPVGHPTSTVHTIISTCDEDEPTVTPAPGHSTIYTTDLETITSCPPEVTDCPASTKKPVMTTSTVSETKIYTITACPPTVTDCPIGKVTSTIEIKTTVCPVETAKPTKPVETIPAPPKDTGVPTKPVIVCPGHESCPPATSSVGPSKPVIVCPGHESCPPATSAVVIPPPVLSTQTISTCVPTVIYSVVTVTSAAPTKPVSTGPAVVCPGHESCPGASLTTVKGPYGTSAPTGAMPYPPKNSTISFTGGASSQRAGGLLLAAAIAGAALL